VTVRMGVPCNAARGGTTEGHVAARWPPLAVIVVLAAGGVETSLAQGPLDVMWMSGGHSSYVESLAYSTDGSQIASASADYTVKLWRGCRWLR